MEGPLHWDVFLWVYFCCIFLLVVTGMYVLVVQIKILWQDSVYKKWDKEANCLQKSYQYILNAISIFNFKITHALFCGIRSLPLL